MIKRIVIVLVVIVAGWFIYTRFIAKPAAPPPPVEGPEISKSPVSESPEEPPVTTDGVKLFNEGKYKDAARRLEQELNERKAADHPTILNCLALSYENLSNNDKAVQTWQKLLDEFPSHSLGGNAYYHLGILETDAEKRVEWFQKAIDKKYETSVGAQLAALELGDYYLTTSLPEMEKQHKARACFTLALKNKELSADKKLAIKKKLELINRNLVFSPTINPADSKLHTIERGETIWTISQKYKIQPGSDEEGQEHLGQIRRINHIKTANIRAGDTVKVMTGRFSVVVDKSDFILTLYLDGNFVKEYPVAIGKPKENPTPEGVFYTDPNAKLVKPVWHRYDKNTGKTEEIPYGDPRNLLGTRWIGFKQKDNKVKSRLGIHGTANPESIGKAITDGCVRMLNEDVEELFDLLPPDAEIIIQE